MSMPMAIVRWSFAGAGRAHAADRERADSQRRGERRGYAA
jgi:hypothetical protein